MTVGTFRNSHGCADSSIFAWMTRIWTQLRAHKSPSRCSNVAHILLIICPLTLSKPRLHSFIPAERILENKIYLQGQWLYVKMISASADLWYVLVQHWPTLSDAAACLLLRLETHTNSKPVLKANSVIDEQAASVSSAQSLAAAIAWSLKLYVPFPFLYKYKICCYSAQHLFLIHSQYKDWQDKGRGGHHFWFYEMGLQTTDPVSLSLSNYEAYIWKAC